MWWQWDCSGIMHGDMVGGTWCTLWWHRDTALGWQWDEVGRDIVAPRWHWDGIGVLHRDRVALGWLWGEGRRDVGALGWHWDCTGVVHGDVGALG